MNKYVITQIVYETCFYAMVFCLGYYGTIKAFEVIDKITYNVKKTVLNINSIE